jgi:hypothetical protein
VLGEALQATVKGVALDGATVNIRKEGWKELKVGSVFEVEVRPTRDRETGDLIDLAHAVHNTYVAHLGGPEVFGQLIWAEARRRQWSQAQETVALGDGAPWIWNLVGEHFYDSRQVVDWYHAATHLRQAANALKGEHTPEAQRWFKAYDTQLFEGQADQIADTLRTLAKSNRKVADVLRREAGYFDEHQRRMQYQEIREDGLPIGSGMVESACKQFRARLAGPGMRWNERMLPIRAAAMNRNFEAWWQSVSALPSIEMHPQSPRPRRSGLAGLRSRAKASPCAALSGEAHRSSLGLTRSAPTPLSSPACVHAVPVCGWPRPIRGYCRGRSKR